MQIDSPIVDLAGEISALPTVLLEASALLRDRCASRTAAQAGRFVVSGTARLGKGPDGPLSSTSLASPGIALEGIVVERDEETGPTALIVGCRNAVAPL